MTTSRQWMYLFVAFLLVLIGVAILLPAVPWFKEAPVLEKAASGTVSTGKIRDIHLFTVEYKATINGQEAEAYRWDPGTIVIQKGETVRLHLHGFHGKEHHFSIPAFKVKGTVKKGEVTAVEITPKRTGTFELICHNHLSHHTHGPMIGYISVVQP